MQGFQTTRWSLIAAIETEESQPRLAALNEIVQLYWHPLYWFTRRFGFDETEAEDQVQEFLSRLLQTDFFSQADRRRGKLRTYLLGCLKHHLLDARKAAKRKKRGGKVHLLSLDENLNEVPGILETQYDQEWAKATLNAAISVIADQQEKKGRSELFEALRPYLVGEGERGLAKIAIRFDMQEGAVRLALHRLRKQFRTQLREEVRQTLPPGDDLDEELRYLAEVLG